MIRNRNNEENLIDNSFFRYIVIESSIVIRNRKDEENLIDNSFLDSRIVIKDNSFYGNT